VGYGDPLMRRSNKLRPDYAARLPGYSQMGDWRVWPALGRPGATPGVWSRLDYDDIQPDGTFTSAGLDLLGRLWAAAGRSSTKAPIRRGR